MSYWEMVFQGPRGEGRNAVGFEITEAGYPPYEMSELDSEMESILEEWGSQRGEGGYPYSASLQLMRN